MFVKNLIRLLLKMLLTVTYMVDPDSGGGSQSQIKRRRRVEPSEVPVDVNIFREVRSSDLNSDSCAAFDVCMTQSVASAISVKNNAIDAIKESAPDGWGNTIVYTSEELIDLRPLLMKSQRGIGYLLVVNLNKFKLYRGTWSKVFLVRGTILNWRCTIKGCGITCKTELASPRLDDQKWLSAPGFLTHDHPVTLGKLSKRLPGIQNTIKDFRDACDVAIGQAVVHGDGSIPYIVESVYAAFDEDVRTSMDLVTEKQFARRRFKRKHPDNVFVKLDRYKVSDLKLIFKEVNDGDFLAACKLMRRNPSDTDEVLLSSLVDWNPKGKSWEDDFQKTSNYFMVFSSPCGAVLHARGSAHLYDDTYKSTPRAWSSGQGKGGALTTMSFWAGKWWETSRILRVSKTAESTEEQLWGFQSYIQEVLLVRDVVAIRQSLFMSDFDTVLAKAVSKIVKYTMIKKGLWHFRKNIDKHIRKASSALKLILRGGGIMLVWFRMISVLGALPVDWIIPFYQDAVNALVSIHADTSAILDKICKTYIVGSDGTRVSRSSAEELSWFQCIEARSEMAVERMHKEYNKPSNYGNHPMMSKFAKVFAKMELIRRDKCIRYERLIEECKVPNKRNRSSDKITASIVECRMYSLEKR